MESQLKYTGVEIKPTNSDILRTFLESNMKLALHLWYVKEVIQEKYNIGIVIIYMEQVQVKLYQKETLLELESLMERKIIFRKHF